jgi:hypothetical protein
MAFSNANILTINTSSTNIGTSSYVQLSASIPIGTCRIVLANATTSLLILGYGASGSETGYVCIGGGATLQVDVPSTAIMPKGTRLALIAVDSTASSGYVTVTLLP